MQFSVVTVKMGIRCSVSVRRYNFTVKMTLIAANLNSWERTVISQSFQRRGRGTTNSRFPKNSEKIFTFILFNIFILGCLCFKPF